MLINPNGFREYDARWVFEKDIDLEGIEQLGKGLGSQIINKTRINYCLLNQANFGTSKGRFLIPFL